MGLFANCNQAVQCSLWINIFEFRVQLIRPIVPTKYLVDLNAHWYIVGMGEMVTYANCLCQWKIGIQIFWMPFSYICKLLILKEKWKKLLPLGVAENKSSNKELQKQILCIIDFRNIRYRKCIPLDNYNILPNWYIFCLKKILILTNF